MTQLPGEHLLPICPVQVKNVVHRCASCWCGSPMHYSFSYRLSSVETVETSCSITVNSLRQRPCNRIVPAESARKIRIVVAKPGLDGHDRGAKIIARALRDAGMEVIYTGLHQTPEQIAETVLQEDADAVGLSILSGAHLTLFPRVLDELRDRGLGDVLVFGGGVIPEADVRQLRESGVAAVFGPGSSLREISAWLESALDARMDDDVTGEAV